MNNLILAITCVLVGMATAKTLSKRSFGLRANNGCYAGEFRCSSTGTCLADHWKCDGKPDCADGEDEQNCDKRTFGVRANNGCYPGEFQCASTGTCLADYWVCDGDNDCPNGEDEQQNCDKRSLKNAWSLAQKLDYMRRRGQRGESGFYHAKVESEADKRSSMDEEKNVDQLLGELKRLLQK